MTDQTTDDFTELTKAEFDRLDAVGAPANGTDFLIMKATEEGRSPSLGALFEAGYVEDLIAKADQENHLTDQTPIVKADALDATELLATPAGSTAESAPGSPDWEQLDFDTAMKWAAVLGRAKSALEALAGRELQEAANGDDDGADNAMDLADAATAIDYAVDTLAGYAVGESNDVIAADLGDVAKAAQAIDLDSLSALEGFAPIVKAGRTLSAANEALLNTASQALQKVLATLPAPTTPDAAPVAKSKETAVTTTTTPTADTGDIVITKAMLEALPADALAAVYKAKGDPLTPVYNEDGKLVGMAQGSDIIPIATADAASGADPAPADPAAADPGSDLTPQDPAAAGVPADGTPPPLPADPAAVAKSTSTEALDVEAIVKAALEEQSAEHEAILKSLREDIEHLKAPAPSRVLTNGAIPRAVLRGQDIGSGTTDERIVKSAELRGQLSTASTPAEAEALRAQMTANAAATLADLHGRRATS